MIAIDRVWRVGVAILAGLLACGLPLWPIPYSRVSMPGNPSAEVWLLGGAASGLLAALLLRTRFIWPTLCVAAGFVLAVLGRVAVETSRDPTSHNLWPFEVVVAGAIGAFAAAIGVGLGRVAQRVGRGGSAH